MLFWIKEIKTKKKIIEPVGTLRYASTEALANKLYNSSKIDIFSLGVILFYLINNSTLFNKAKEVDIFVINKIKNFEKYLGEFKNIGKGIGSK